MTARTEELPGVEGEGVSPKKIKSLDNACDKWREIVTSRMELTERECEARDKVIALMYEHSVVAYPYYDGDERKLLVLKTGPEKLKLISAEETATEPDAEND